jgi:DNA-binding transcriptional MerR regulator
MSEEPVYNIGIVSRMTGIPENTLRMWERRYNFPTPTRTDGGHRLYSPQEVERVRWVKQRIDQGMQTRNAIQALEQSEATDQLVEAVPRLGLSTPSARSGETIRERLFDALVALDKQQAELIIGDALAVHSLEHLLLAVIAPTFTAIGQAWEEDRISIATEHYATNYLRQKLLMWMQTAPPEYPIRPVVLACAPGELHEGGLLILGLLLQRLRWPIIYLGQSVVLADLVSFVEKTKPSLVVFVAMTANTAQALSQWPEWLSKKERDGAPIVAYAGYIFVQDPAWIERIPGVYLGSTLLDGMEKVDDLLRHMNPFLG